MFESGVRNEIGCVGSVEILRVDVDQERMNNF